MSVQDGRCTFAPLGTFNHECGKPATVVGVKPSKRTKSGIFYGACCDACKTIKGGDNAGITHFLPIDPATQINEFK